VRLVDQNSRVRQSEALALRARGQENGRSGRRLAHDDGRDIGLDVLHGVVHGEQRRYVASRRVDVDRDVLVGLLGLEVDELSHHQVGHLVVDRCAEEHDAVLEEPGVDVERALAPVRLLDDHGDQVVFHQLVLSLVSEA
jgi:hypothetical protein